MDYLLIIVLSFTIGFTVAFLLQILRNKKKNNNTIIDYKNLLIKYNEITEALKIAIKTSETNKELYEETMELYKTTMKHYQEVTEDLDYAKSIISGDFSYMN